MPNLRGILILSVSCRSRSAVGVKEKVLGAHRAGANKVIVPWANRKDVELDVPMGAHAYAVRVCADGAGGTRCCVRRRDAAVALAHADCREQAIN
jgi:hypothetical protein